MNALAATYIMTKETGKEQAIWINSHAELHANITIRLNSPSDRPQLSIVKQHTNLILPWLISPQTLGQVSCLLPPTSQTTSLLTDMIMVSLN